MLLLNDNYLLNHLTDVDLLLLHDDYYCHQVLLSKIEIKGSFFIIDRSFYTMMLNIKESITEIPCIQLSLYTAELNRTSRVPYEKFDSTMLCVE